GTSYPAYPGAPGEVPGPKAVGSIPMNDPGSSLPPRPDIGGPTSPEIGAVYATFWQRVAGRVIDALILSAPFAIVGVAVFCNDIVRLRDQLGRAPTSWELMNNLGGRYV